VKYGGAVLEGALLAGCSGDGREPTEPGEQTTDASTPTETTSASEDPTRTADAEVSYTVAMAPMGDVTFESPPETVSTWLTHHADIALVLGRGDTMTAMHAPEYHDGVWNQFVERLPGVELDCTGLYSPGSRTRRRYTDSTATSTWPTRPGSPNSTRGIDPTSRRSPRPWARSVPRPASQFDLVSVIGDVREPPDGVPHDVRTDRLREEDVIALEFPIGVVAPDPDVHLGSLRKEDELGLAGGLARDDVDAVGGRDEVVGFGIHGRYRLRGRHPFLGEFLDVLANLLLVAARVSAVRDPLDRHRPFGARALGVLDP
jgi:hypothetical protein